MSPRLPRISSRATTTRLLAILFRGQAFSILNELPPKRLESGYAIDYATIELKTRGEIISLDNFNNRAIIARFLRNLANESDY